MQTQQLLVFLLMSMQSNWRCTLSTRLATNSTPSQPACSSLHIRFTSCYQFNAHLIVLAWKDLILLFTSFP